MRAERHEQVLDYLSAAESQLMSVVKELHAAGHEILRVQGDAEVNGEEGEGDRAFLADEELQAITSLTLDTRRLVGHFKARWQEHGP